MTTTGHKDVLQGTVESHREVVVQNPSAKSRASSTTQTEEFVECEKTIESGLRTFIEVGSALLAIRNGKLYTQCGYDNFEDYCQERWEMERAYAYRLINSAQVVENLRKPLENSEKVSPIGDTLPLTESQVRPLTALESEQQSEAWAEAVKQSPKGRPTATIVQKIVDKIRSKTQKKKALVRASGWSKAMLDDDKELHDAFVRIEKVYGREDTTALRNGTIETLKRADIIMLANVPAAKQAELQNLIMALHWTPKRAMQFLSKMPHGRTCLDEMQNYCLSTKGSYYVVQIGGFEHTRKSERAARRK